MKKIENLFQAIPKTLPEEFFETIAETSGVRVERIVSEGHISTKWYDQEEDEWVCLLQGEARLTFEDGSETTLMTGDHLLIKAHEKHKVSYTSSEPRAVWLAVFITK